MPNYWLISMMRVEKGVRNLLDFGRSVQTGVLTAFKDHNGGRKTGSRRLRVRDR